jgi:hypothetical protein
MPESLRDAFVGQSGQSKNSKYAYSEPDPAQLCNEGNSCDSDSTPCTMDVKRKSNSASSAPRIQDARAMRSTVYLLT